MDGTTPKETQLDLKESKAKTDAESGKERRWLSSPLILTLAGLLGTGFGAALQGYSSFQLERQKFEFNLVQKALETKDRSEAAKQLVFLIDSGVIRSLDTERIREIVENNQLPTSLNASAKRKAVLKPSSKGTYQLVSAGGLCLDAKDYGYDKEGGSLQVWSCSSQPPLPPQWWKFQLQQGLQQGRILSAGNLCLDAKDYGEKRLGNPLHLWKCNTQAAQKWTYLHGKILSAGNLCLAIKNNGESQDGSPLHLEQCKGSPTQTWSLRQVEVE
ncbi:MAG: RICIN domain-containing protein [Myxacorys californica WJT36-NPBG1]|jgi:hypothetical protein|nr:RICIN domain-containing protein [Myxacorys californica WJT36-NPBG1]